jgi:predicted secreted protein
MRASFSLPRRRAQLAALMLMTGLATGAPAAAADDAARNPDGVQASARFPHMNLSADAWREVQQDRVTVTLYAQHEALQAGPAQARVNEVLDPVLARLKAMPDIEVQSAGYRTTPVWQDSRIVSWRARGALRLTAEPSPGFNALVGELATSLGIESVSHFLSREARTQVEQALIKEAIASFRAKAQAASAAFGYSGWTIHSVSVNDSGGGMPPPAMPRVAMARMADAAEAAPMPILEGRATVSVSVNGTVVLTR